MAAFSDVISAKLRGHTISRLYLVFLDFEGDPKYLFLGHGKVRAGGKLWDGLGGLVSIEGLGSAVGTAATQLKFTLSGVDAAFISLAASEVDKVKDRRCVVSIQFFDEDTGQTIGEPYAIRTGIMDQLSFAAPDVNTRVVSLTVEGNWVNRKRPAYSLYTDRDQKWRWPDDRGLEQVSDCVNKTVRWPVFS